MGERNLQHIDTNVAEAVAREIKGIYGHRRYDCRRRRQLSGVPNRRAIADRSGAGIISVCAMMNAVVLQDA